MQSDEARKWTDKQLSEMEDKIYKIYAEALESMQVKWDDFAKKIEPEIATYKKRLDEAIKSGDSATIKEARSQYADVLREKTLMDRYYKDMVDQTIDELSNVNQTAVAYLNDEVAQIYAINYNQFAKDLPKIKSNYVFDLVDASTVKVLATKDDSLLPYKQIDKYKDEAWNRKIINSQILQGIVEGESINKIAKRLRNVVNADESSAIRNARTMTTSAECKGRIDSYHKAVSNGIRMKKVWIATSDDRTRAWHMELDGAEADVDEPFVNEYGEIMQPGDPDADPCNVYNCRCSIKMKFLGFEKPEDENQKQIDTSEQEQEALASAEVGTPMLEYNSEESERREAFPEKPERPKKDSFTDEDEYYKAKDEYKIQRAEYEEKIQKILDEEINKPRQYDTKESVLEWCEQNNVRIDDAVLDKLDLRIMDDVISVQEEMFERFPMIKESQDQYYPYGFSMNGNSDFLFEASGGLNFGDCWSNYETALKTNVLDAFGKGVLTLGDGTVKTTIRHEFGHNVDSYIRSALREQYHMGDTSWRTSFSSLEEYKVAEAEYFNNIREYSKDLKELTKTYCSTDYAFTNEVESFAEGFAEYTSNPNSEYGKAFGEFLKRWM